MPEAQWKCVVCLAVWLPEVTLRLFGENFFDGSQRWELPSDRAGADSEAVAYKLPRWSYWKIIVSGLRLSLKAFVVIVAPKTSSPMIANTAGPRNPIPFAALAATARNYEARVRCASSCMRSLLSVDLPAISTSSLRRSYSTKVSLLVISAFGLSVSSQRLYCPFPVMRSSIVFGLHQQPAAVCRIIDHLILNVEYGLRTESLDEPAFTCSSHSHS